MSSLAHENIVYAIGYFNPPRLFLETSDGFWMVGTIREYIIELIETGKIFFIDDFWKLDVHYKLGILLGYDHLNNSFEDFYQAATVAGNESAIMSLEFWRSNPYNPQ